MAKAAPAKHKIRVATLARGGLSPGIMSRVATCNLRQVLHNTNRIVQWRRKNDQNAMPANGATDKWNGEGAAILFAAALPLPAAICALRRPPFLTFLAVLQRAGEPKAAN